MKIKKQYSGMVGTWKLVQEIEMKHAIAPLINGSSWLRRIWVWCMFISKKHKFENTWRSKISDRWMLSVGTRFTNISYELNFHLNKIIWKNNIILSWKLFSKFRLNSIGLSVWWFLLNISASVGGIVGLCMGFSFLSLAEFVYFFTIRLLMDRIRR